MSIEYYECLGSDPFRLFSKGALSEANVEAFLYFLRDN